MTTADVARSERVLAKIGGALGLQPSGAEWLKAAVDPFHDTPLDVCGYPDTNEAASVVQVVRVSANIAVPSSVTSPNNWDCHIHSFPWFGVDSPLIGTIQTNDIGTQNYGPLAITNFNATTAPMGNLGVCSVPAGTATWDSGASNTDSHIQFPLLSQIAPYLRGEYRVIAKGYEVINTTSDLNVQGLVTVYRQPFPDTDTAKGQWVFETQEGGGPTISAQGFPSAVWTEFPPENSGTALLLDGSKQWKAKEGAYVVDTLNSEEIPAGIDLACCVLKPPTTDTNFSTNGALISGVAAKLLMSVPPTSTTNTYYGIGPVGLLPTKFNQSGVYFTGLSYSTTLTLNAIYYIERFPSQQDSDLVVLAKHSCRSDPVARALYSEIIRMMPVGVPQRMNGMGEWFADAVSSAADFISPVLSAIPTPMTQGLAGIVRTAGGVAKSLGSKKEAPATYSATGSNTTAAPKQVANVMKSVAGQPKKAKKKVKVGKKK